MIRTTKIVVSPSPPSEKPLNPPPASAKTISLDRVKLDQTPQRLGNILLQKHMTMKLIDPETDTILMTHLVDKQRLFVGRGDPQLKQNLDIDFIGYGGREHGVSRLHAAFRRMGHLLAIVDLNSTNGTYRNGTRLLPGQSHFLLNNDEIRFGKMLFHIRFEY
jgi:hypothetical protein